MSEMCPALDARLGTIYDMLGQVDSVADIGTDHGYLGARLLADGRAKRVQFLDISEMSLNKARRLMERLGFLPQSDFAVGDGAQALLYPPNAVVIAGMGGSTIAHILRSGRARLHPARILMQPNVAADEVRRALCEIGYRIDDERVVRAAGRFYVIISAVPGEASYDERQRQIGPILLERRPEALADYAAFKVRVARKALAGAQKSQRDVQQAFIDELRLWEPLMRREGEGQ
ncbi:MAG: class I SAM-dependent methyltransferase [Clostridia bacterium]|nr:class I SAM-dependent methyltransferase [Clostridia bacterium]